MQSLGIDPVRTAESVKNDSYDHHAAIYFLLQDKLQSSTMTSQNMPKTNKTASDSPARKQMSAGTYVIFYKGKFLWIMVQFWNLDEKLGCFLSMIWLFFSCLLKGVEYGNFNLKG